MTDASDACGVQRPRFHGYPELAHSVVLLEALIEPSWTSYRLLEVYLAGAQQALITFSAFGFYGGQPVFGQL